MDRILATASAIEVTSHGGITSILEGPIRVGSTDPGPKEARGHAEVSARRPGGPAIRCYGCTPLRFPDGFDFISLLRGVDERVPVGSAARGATVVDHILQEV